MLQGFDHRHLSPLSDKIRDGPKCGHGLTGLAGHVNFESFSAGLMNGKEACATPE